MPAIVCKQCGGSGTKKQHKGVYGVIDKCFWCSGSGIENYCKSCNGTGEENYRESESLVCLGSCRTCHGAKHVLDHIHVPIPKEIVIRDYGEAFADVKVYEIHEEYTDSYSQYKNLEWFDWSI